MPELTEEELQEIRDKASKYDELLPEYTKLQDKDFNFSQANQKIRALERKLEEVNNIPIEKKPKDEPKDSDEVEKAKQALQEEIARTNQLKEDLKLDRLLHEYARSDDEVAKVKEKLKILRAPANDEELQENIKMAVKLAEADRPKVDPLYNTVSSYSAPSYSYQHAKPSTVSKEEERALVDKLGLSYLDKKILPKY